MTTTSLIKNFFKKIYLHKSYKVHTIILSIFNACLASECMGADYLNL